MCDFSSRPASRGPPLFSSESFIVIEEIDDAGRPVMTNAEKVETLRFFGRVEFEDDGGRWRCWVESGYGPVGLRPAGSADFLALAGLGASYGEALAQLWDCAIHAGNRVVIGNGEGRHEYCWDRANRGWEQVEGPNMVESPRLIDAHISRVTINGREVTGVASVTLSVSDGSLVPVWDESERAAWKATSAEREETWRDRPPLL
jgi:hypothetical protein